jgi:predicted nucleic acid-binding protein
MRAVFLDTVGMLAVWDVADQWHAAAEQAFDDLLQKNVSLVSTNYVLMECGNAAARRPYRDRVTRLRSQLLEDGLIFDPTPEERRRLGMPTNVAKLAMQPLWTTYHSS